ncbi:MAG TPA: alpha/beta hydrolase [Gemmataceae bacterium]|jgi:poly(3-hydroxybutyrate) depolymerase|nr:alpha/beta hydrolase [Gemmataceae bacterium]
MLHRIAILLPFFLGAAALNADEPKFEVEKHNNLSYNSAKDADPVRHQLDLYVPKGAKNYPVMVFVHGGKWTSGKKELYAPLGETFAKQGIGTAVINYRLSDSKGTIKHPDHIHDVAKAVAWVKANCGKYGGDKDHLFLSGHSAGGHLVALLALDESYLKAEGCSTRDICGVTAVSGVYTIPTIGFGNVFGTEEEVCKAASPINHVKGHHPPFLIAYGTKDFPFMDLMAEDLGKKLKQAKCDATVMKLERDHYSIIIEMGTKASDELDQAMVKFMTRK